MMNPHPDLDESERYPRKPSHAILISLTAPENHSLSGGSRGINPHGNLQDRGSDE